MVLVTGTLNEDGDEMTIRSMSKANYVVGTVTSTGANYIRVNGEKYEISETNEATVGDTGYKYDKNAAEYTYYLDGTGNIIYATTEEPQTTPVKYVYVLARAAKAADADADNLFETAPGAAAAAQVKVINLETGAVELKNIAVVKDTTNGKYYYAGPDGKKPATGAVEVTKVSATDVDAFYTYTELSNGDIVLGEEAGIEDTVTVEVKKDNASLGAGVAGYANNATKVTIYEKGEKDAISSKGYTGIANFPTENFKIDTTTGAETYDIVVISNGLLVSEIIVVRDPKVAITTANYAIFAEVGETDGNGTAYKFYVDGELKTYYSDADDLVASTVKKGDVFTLSFEDEKLDTITAAENKASVTVVEAVGDYFVVREGEGESATAKVYTLTDNCVIVDAGNSYKLAELAKGDKIDIYTTEADGTNVAFIVIAK